MSPITCGSPQRPVIIQSLRQSEKLCGNSASLWWSIREGKFKCEQITVSLYRMPPNNGLHPTRLSPLEIGGHTRFVVDLAAEALSRDPPHG